MCDHKVTRRRVFVAGTAAAAGVGVSGIPLDSASAADRDLLVGRFVRALGSRAGVVSVDGGEVVSVMLDSGAFVAHGADGIVDTLIPFVPGEQVVVRGGMVKDRVAAVEVQSVYSRVSGAYASQGSEHWLLTATGQRIRVPESVLGRDAPFGISRGDARTATIWTHPVTQEATAVDIKD
jgi:hypothetical protein